MNDWLAIVAMVVGGLTVISYMIYSSGSHTRQLSMLMKQQTDRLIEEGNKRLELSIEDGHKRLEQGTADGNRRLEQSNKDGNARLEAILKAMGIKLEQVFERVDRPHSSEK